MTPWDPNRNFNLDGILIGGQALMYYYAIGCDAIGLTQVSATYTRCRYREEN